MATIEEPTNTYATTGMLPPSGEAMTDEEISAEKARQSMKKLKRKEHGLHEVSEELNIVALMDAFTIILVFLIKSYSSDPTNITQSADLTLPRSTTTLAITEAVPLVITEKAVLVANKAVARMTPDGVDPTEKQGMMIPGVIEALKKEAENQKLIERYNAKVKFEGLVLIIADKKIQFHTLTEVLYSAGQAEFGQYKFAVLKNE